jgi:hypothetical protein
MKSVEGRSWKKFGLVSGIVVTGTVSSNVFESLGKGVSAILEGIDDNLVLIADKSISSSIDVLLSGSGCNLLISESSELMDFGGEEGTGASGSGDEYAFSASEDKSA